MLERRKARHQALHILYQREITDDQVSRILADGSWSVEDGAPSDFCREVITGVEAHQARIDAIIEDISENWALSRMPLVDRSILRLAVYEMLYREDVPESVSINEAVEMAKVYGGGDSSKFVNGILGRLAEVAAAGGFEESVDE
ncbi:MAG: transcription antitermination factor NusB [Coriobacteriia bacterium]|nr:transcription antitermination factor NusB [Coriobacteriia bacterium]